MISDAEEEDPGSLYAVLNVTREASEADIKRAYRNLAQLYHPDKQTDPGLKQLAEASFTRIQAAYEVLSDEARRSVYDVYGRQGLEAGFAVMRHEAKNQKELRRKWAKFQEEQAEERMRTQVSHRGHYVFRVDASNTLDPYESTVDSTPEITSIIAQNHVHLPLSSDAAASIGCQVGARRGLGFGAFLCGIRRDLSPQTSFEAQGMLGGLKALLSLSSTQKFGEAATATIAGTYSHRQGVGMQVSSTHTLGARWQGEAVAIMGVGSIAGISLALTYQAERYQASAKLEVGMQAGVSARWVWVPGNGTTTRVVARWGLTGAQIEVGANRKLAEFNTAGCSIAVGPQGVVVKPSYARGSHLFEVPIMLSDTYRDPVALAVASLVPPLVSLTLHYCVIKPLRRHWKVQEALQRRLSNARGVRTALAAAEGDNALMALVARRQLDTQVLKGGLVIVDARYGDLESILHDEGERIARLNSSEEASTSSTSGPAAAAAARWQAIQEEIDIEDDAEIRAAVEAALAAQEPPSAWADVTTGVRYIMKAGTVTFHPDISKAGLMGFCDVSPGSDKALRVLYYHRSQPFAATLLDLEGGCLPDKGSPLQNDAAVAALRKMAAMQNIELQRSEDVQTAASHDTADSTMQRHAPNGHV